VAPHTEQQNAVLAGVCLGLLLSWCFYVRRRRNPTQRRLHYGSGGGARLPLCTIEIAGGGAKRAGGGAWPRSDAFAADSSSGGIPAAFNIQADASSCTSAVRTVSLLILVNHLDAFSHFWLCSTWRQLLCSAPCPSAICHLLAICDIPLLTLYRRHHLWQLAARRQPRIQTSTWWRHCTEAWCVYSPRSLILRQLLQCCLLAIARPSCVHGLLQ